MNFSNMNRNHDLTKASNQIRVLVDRRKHSCDNISSSFDNLSQGGPRCVAQVFGDVTLITRKEAE